jgi:hypothetical protein
LTTWYRDAHSTDAETRLSAQARLRVQLQLRKARKERNALTSERECRKASGDIEGLKTVKQKLKRIHIGLSPLLLLRNDISADTKLKMAKKWQIECMSLEELLEDKDLDVRGDFTIGDELDQASTNNNAQVTKTSGSSTLVNIRAAPHDTGSAVGLVNDEIRNQDCSTFAATTLGRETDEIWNRHVQAMNGYYMAKGLKQHVINTRIAIQKSAFISQAKQELLINQAHTSLLTLCSQNKSVSIGCAEFISPTGGLWTLSSTKLWQIYEGRKSWDQPRWTPSGHLRICTVGRTSRLYLDFGTCSFTTGPIVLPLVASPHPLIASASCNRFGTDVKLEMFFVGNANLKIRFPVHLLLAADRRSETVLPVDTYAEFANVFDGIAYVEFAGVFDGIC